MNNAAVQRIENILEIININLTSADDSEIIGYKEVVYMVLSNLIYGENVVIDNPHKDIITFVNTLLTKSTGFSRLKNSLHYDVQLVGYAKGLASVLSNIMPMYIKFNENERTELLQTAKQMQTSINAGFEVSDKKLQTVSKRLQAFNEAEKNGGMFAISAPNMFDAVKLFNAKCIKMHHIWSIGWGRLLPTLSFPRMPVDKKEYSALKRIKEEYDLFANNQMTNYLLDSFREPVIPYSKQTVFVIDKPYGISTENKLLLTKVALLMFDMINNGVNIAAVVIPLRRTVMYSHELSPSIHNLSELIDELRREPYYNPYYGNNINIKSYVYDLEQNLSHENNYVVIEDNMNIVVISLLDENKPMFATEEGKRLLEEKFNNIHYIEINSNTNDDEGIRRVIRNEAGI